MPDYAACIDKACPSRSVCARYRMKWGDRQSVGKFTRGTVRCESFFPIGKAPFLLVDVVEADKRSQRTQEGAD